jgi:dTDP-4-dehydrorhamnose 3,5-epimerase-like enzyme
MTSALLQLVEIPQRGDARGSLSIVEMGKTLPFTVKRAYWIHGTRPCVSRGYHAHKELRQLFCCLRGQVTLSVSDGLTKEEVVIKAFGQAAVLGPGLWRVMSNFSEDCILMVLADREYDEADYIRDYEEFRRAKKHD